RQVESRAGESHAPVERLAPASAAVSVAVRRRRAARSVARQRGGEPTASGGRLRRAQRSAGRSGAAVDRSGGAAHAEGSHGARAPRGPRGSERLVTAGLLLAVVSAFTLQGAEVTASVDRTRLTVGEEVMLTVRARTRST